MSFPGNTYRAGQRARRTSDLRRSHAPTTVQPDELGDPATEIGRHNRAIWAAREAWYARLRAEVEADPELHCGETPGRKDGTRWYVLREELRAYLRARPGVILRTGAIAAALGRSQSQCSEWLWKLYQAREVEHVGLGRWRVRA